MLIEKSFNFKRGAGVNPRERVECAEDVLDVDREQGGIRPVGENVPAPHRGVRQHPVGAGRRAPLLGRSGAEDHDRGTTEGAGEMGCPRVDTDDNLGRGDCRQETGERQLAGSDLHGTGSTPRREPRDLQSTGALHGAAGEDHPAAARHEMVHHLCEPFDGPVPAGVAGPDVDDRRPTGGADRTRRMREVQILRIGGDPVRADQADPSVAFMDSVAPLRAVPSRGPVADADPCFQRFESAAAFGTVAVEIDRHVDAAHQIRGHGQRLVEPRGVEQRIDTADEPGHGRQPVRAGEYEPVIRKTAAQASERRDCDQQVTELERAQGEQDGSGVRPRGRSDRADGHGRLPSAVLFDRDDTLIVDVPYNGDPDRVEPIPGAVRSVDRLRRAGIPVGVVSNQSGIGRGILSAGQVRAVNDRVAELVGAFDVWAVCPHVAEDRCGCRKPAPGLVTAAAAALGVDVHGVVVIGDIGADVRAAAAAGCRGILVPTARTRPAEVAAAARDAEVAGSLEEAVSLALSGTLAGKSYAPSDGVRS